MSTISVSQLKKRSVSQWRKSAKGGELVVTSQGQPVAVIVPTDRDSLDSTLAALRSVKALRAQNALQRAAEANGTANIAVTEIDAAETRREALSHKDSNTHS